MKTVIIIILLILTLESGSCDAGEMANCMSLMCGGSLNHKI